MRFSAPPGGVHLEVARLPVQLLRVGRGPLPQRATHRRHPLLQGPGKASCFHHKYNTGDVFGAKFKDLELVIWIDDNFLSSIDLRGAPPGALRVQHLLPLGLHLGAAEAAWRSGSPRHLHQGWLLI